MEEDFYGNNSLAQFDATRSRLLRANEGIAANNRRVRMLGFERAMKAQFGPNVEISVDGTATRRGKVVGNFDEYVKAGGKLQATPKDTRSQLEIRRQENRRLRENYKEPTFEERMNNLFPKKEDNRITSETFSQPTGINLDEMSQYTDTGEESSSDYTDLANLVSAKPEASGTNNTSSRDQLKMGMIERQNRARLGDERVDFLKQKQKDFKSMDRKDFAEKYPKSQTAKRLKLRLKKK